MIMVHAKFFSVPVDREEIFLHRHNPGENGKYILRIRILFNIQDAGPNPEPPAGLI
jgi:hypothetical protein